MNKLNIKRSTPYVLAIAVLLLVITINWETPQQISDNKQGVPQQTRLVKLQQRQFDKNGRLVYTLSAKQVVVNDKQVQLKQPLIFVKRQEADWIIKGEQATTDRNYHYFTLNREVTVEHKADQPLRLNADTLHYSVVEQLLSSDTQIKLQDSTLNFTAGGIELDLANNSYRLLGGINATQAE